MQEQRCKMPAVSVIATKVTTETSPGLENQNTGSKREGCQMSAGGEEPLNSCDGGEGEEGEEEYLGTWASELESQRDVGVFGRTVTLYCIVNYSVLRPSNTIIIL